MTDFFFLRQAALPMRKAADGSYELALLPAEGTIYDAYAEACRMAAASLAKLNEQFEQQQRSAARATEAVGILSDALTAQRPAKKTSSPPHRAPWEKRRSRRHR